MKFKKIKQLKQWYEIHERKISIGSLLSGFLIDSLTLQSIDALRENLWIALNLLVVAISIIYLNRKGSHFFVSNLIQFSFGALLGSFFIFYFRSTTLSATWPFLVILLLAMVANELFQKRYEKLAFQLSFFYFSIFSFAIFLLPLIIKRLGPEVFVLSGLLSLFIIWIFILLIKDLVREKFLESKTHIWSMVWVIFAGINLLYFTNLIPPIPLSLKDSGVYHSLVRSGTNYVVKEEPQDWKQALNFRERLHWVVGRDVYAYTAIYAPGSLNTDVVHHWQHKNEEGKWVTASRIPLSLSGGRSGGFRTYSNKSDLSAGPWRVDVETSRGQLIGRLNFLVIPVSAEPALVTSVKN